jgi:tRNA modification GTPase
MTATDTIFALSSGAGRAALAVIRLSGPQSGFVLENIAGELPSARTLAVRNITDPGSREPLDRAIVTWLPAPRSFTGEDCAELHLHGSSAVVSAVMEVLGSFSGVRPAEAGEFTRRAFLNGKMDLLEAEGLADLLESRTAYQRRQAFRQMSGNASSVFDGWREDLMLLRADIEAVVDFSEEEGVAEAAAPEIERRLRDLLAQLQDAISLSRSAEIVRDGIRVVLAGHPNTGKSRLLNRLARREAAIVSNVAGTTRDSIEVFLDLEGLPIILTDTAGLRSAAGDIVEEEGIRRSRQQLRAADVIIWVWSADIPGSADFDADLCPDLIVQNKSDLPSASISPPFSRSSISLSAETLDGFDVFMPELISCVRSRLGDIESSLLVSARQKKTMAEAVRHLEMAATLDKGRLELKAEEIRKASEEIGRLTGRVDVEEWLGAIFSRFCIGK